MHQHAPVVHPEQSKVVWQRPQILFIETCCCDFAKISKVHTSDSEVNDYLLVFLIFRCSIERRFCNAIHCLNVV